MPEVAVVDAVDRLPADVSVALRPDLGGCPQRDDRIGQERLQSLGHSFSAPALAFMIRRWKTKKSTATGIVMMSAAASFNGYCVP